MAKNKELVEEDNEMLNAVVDLLIEKQVISEADLRKRMDKMQKDKKRAEKTNIAKEFEGVDI
ncbi:MAG: hypothetical protein ABIJ34_03470 [archaeon]